MTVSVGCFLLFALIGSLSADGPLRRADEAIARWLPTVYTSRAAFFFALATYLGNWKVLIGAVGVLGGVSWWRGRPRWGTALTVALATASAGVLDKVLKALITRPRPLAPLYPEPGYAYPSGHVMLAMAFFGMSAWLVLRSGAARGWKVLSLAGGALAVVLVSVSRVYLGVHWPSDVLGGFAAGAGWLSLCLAALMVGDR